MLSIHQRSDAELVFDYQSGNVAAMESLIARYKDKIYTGILILVKDKYVAEDIFQETFLKMIRTLKEKRYSEQGKFLPWATRVAHNLCMDHFRKTRAVMSISLPDGCDISEFIPMGPSSNAEENMERRQTHDSVRQLVEALPEEQREVITLRMYGDLSFREISEMTNVSINTALGRMRYGLINMRKMITDKQLVLR